MRFKFMQFKHTKYTDFLKGTVSRDFRYWFFPKSTTIPPPGPWFTGGSRFAYYFEFTKKFDSEIAKIGFRGVNETAEDDIFGCSSTLTFRFSRKYKYVMFTYVFVFAIVSI
jgi:hypothetical protein